MRTKPKNKKGFLIVCEGVSGSGKTEIVGQIFDFLVKKNYPCFLFEWNSNHLVRKLILKLNKNRLLNSTIYSIIQWTGFIFDYLFKIIPRLRSNIIVIADRYIYTGLTRDATNGSPNWFGWLIHHTVRKPDFLVFQDTDLELCYERIKIRGKKLFHPNQVILNNKLLKNKDLYYLRKIRREYLKLFSNPTVMGYIKFVFAKEHNSDTLLKIETLLKQKLNENYLPSSLTEKVV